MKKTVHTISRELHAHMPFTLTGTLTAIIIMWLSVHAQVARPVLESLFWFLHPLHVFLSALVTAGMYRLHGPGRLLPTLVIGYVGSLGIGTLSDCIIPYIGEVMLHMPGRELHIGFIEKWWLVNPLALAGIALAWWRPATKFPHAGHVLLSTWASLFHMLMAMGADFSLVSMTMTAVFLFLAVWVPCCTSDIAFPLLFAARNKKS